jgi:hypothetical protein
MTFKARLGIICTRANVLSQFLNQPSRMGLNDVKQADYPVIKKAVEAEIEEIKHQLKLMQQTSDTGE